MIALAATLVRLGRAIVRGIEDPEFRALLVVLLVLLTSGTAFYVNVEGWSVLDAVYFSVTTVATVGFGDLAPQTDAGKVFTILYILAGVGVFVALVARIAARMIEPRVRAD